MENVLEGVLKLKDKEGKLVAVVENDLTRRAQVFYKTTECGMDDIKELLDSYREEAPLIERIIR